MKKNTCNISRTTIDNLFVLNIVVFIFTVLIFVYTLYLMILPTYYLDLDYMRISNQLMSL